MLEYTEEVRIGWQAVLSGDDSELELAKIARLRIKEPRCQSLAVALIAMASGAIVGIELSAKRRLRVVLARRLRLLDARYRRGRLLVRPVLSVERHKNTHRRSG